MKTINYSKNFALAAAAGLGVTFFAIGAHADATDVVVPARTVHYADLNLDTQGGAEALYRRIRHAAEQVCDYVGSRQWAEAEAAKACVSQAVNNSVRAVNSVRLTSTYNEHAGVKTNLNIASLR